MTDIRITNPLGERERWGVSVTRQVFGLLSSMLSPLEHVPTKLHDFVDKDMLQIIDLARFLSAK